MRLARRRPIATDNRIRSRLDGLPRRSRVTFRVNVPSSVYVKQTQLRPVLLPSDRQRRFYVAASRASHLDGIDGEFL